MLLRYETKQNLKTYLSSILELHQVSLRHYLFVELLVAPAKTLDDLLEISTEVAFCKNVHLLKKWLFTFSVENKTTSLQRA